MNHTWKRQLAVMIGLALLFGCGPDTDGDPVQTADAVTKTDSVSTGGDTTAEPDADPIPPPPQCPLESESGADIVHTRMGTVRGVLDGNGYTYRGLPYAAPPTGQRRFAPPAEVECLDGVFDASEFKSYCPQRIWPPPEDSFAPKYGGDEDCLGLNVYAPAAADSRPVMVYIHGGGHESGASSPLPFDPQPVDRGRRLADATNSVVVTFNYRLGVLGYLALPALADDNEVGQVGNYGTLDQIAALRWVHHNIASFGGDPSRVMVFGGGTGGQDACALLASPLAAGLFSSVAIQSAPCSALESQIARGDAEARVQKSQCRDSTDAIACLRELDADQLMYQLATAALLSGTRPLGPAVDGRVLTKQPQAVIEAGEHNPMPILIGSNAEDMSANRLFGPIESDDAYESAVTQFLESHDASWVERALTTYPASEYPSPQHAMTAILSDLAMTCPTGRLAQAIAQSQSPPVFRYFFRRPVGTSDGQRSAFHGAELLYLFDAVSQFYGEPAPEEAELSAQMMRYWSRFAETGDPNGPGEPEWPAVTESDPHIIFDKPTQIGAGLRTEECQFWADLKTAIESAPK